jgi:septal ring factor EnvC (AmiA/AmiB activator)
LLRQKASEVEKLRAGLDGMEQRLAALEQRTAQARRSRNLARATHVANRRAPDERKPTARRRREGRLPNMIGSAPLFIWN